MTNDYPDDQGFFSRDTIQLLKDNWDELLFKRIGKACPDDLTYHFKWWDEKTYGV